ncbi:hypothetical protein, conserved [Eimeria tenella]|uniref:Uncharacterized protein n=1 Tax=Eimeria tenella TaxID=5802 RepID=U6L750_EIMTE|nr:hypothetical protein, conserved [Eimeria tenella]CDJ45028.1 hypothetical protein, conserved [Eimeria tenella]|eukprot:XP_013235775.1 hypothetical protein, conserved [Eimeria tenella]
MRVMGDRPYPVSETFVTSAGRRTHPPKRKASDDQPPTRHELASRRMEKLIAHARESCMFRKKAIDAAALQIALKERTAEQVGWEWKKLAYATDPSSTANSADISASIGGDQRTPESESLASYKFAVPDDRSSNLLTSADKAEQYFQQVDLQPDAS